MCGKKIYSGLAMMIFLLLTVSIAGATATDTVNLVTRISTQTQYTVGGTWNNCPAVCHDAVIDNDWSTSGRAAAPYPTEAYLNVSYNLSHIVDINNLYWLIKYSSTQSWEALPESCYDRSDNAILIAMTSIYGSGVEFYCYDEDDITRYQIIDTTPIGSPNIFEEEIYFNHTAYLNITEGDISYGFNFFENQTINITINNTYNNSFNCTITINNETEYSDFIDETKPYNFSIISGYNEVYANCTNESLMIDYSNTTTRVNLEGVWNLSTNYVNITLINEETGLVFNITDENITLFVPEKNLNFTINDTTDELFYLSDTNDTLRLNIEYAGLSGVITRDFDMNLIKEDELKICVPPEQTLYEQIIYSSSQQPVAVYNVFADCYVLIDYTRFTYSDALMAKAYTMPATYYLYTWDNNTKSVLADIDGGQALEINLGLIEFARRSYSIALLGEELSISPHTNTSFKIYYRNQKDENDQIIITVYNGTNVLYTHTETSSPNDITVYYDHSADNLTDVLMRVEIEKYLSGESQGIIEKLFYANGATGFFNPYIAILLSMILMFFTLTFVSVRYTFGYFGIITSLIGLAILSQAPHNQYVILMEVIEVIILIYIILIYKGENASIT